MALLHSGGGMRVGEKASFIVYEVPVALKVLIILITIRNTELSDEELIVPFTGCLVL